MKFAYAALGALVAGAVAGWFWPASADESLPMDRPTSVGGIETVCTGVGQEAQQDPRWESYPVRIELSNGGAQFLSGAHLVLTDSGGRELANVDCEGSWVLFRVNPGAYKVTATLTHQPGGSRTARFSSPRSGQKLVVLGFSVAANR
ncbi:MAG TPA: hypothetical protein VGI20_04720 [Rhizomicrobium sp.]|jgi:hypothetical protein